jgi:hypothetical protein
VKAIMRAVLATLLMVEMAAAKELPEAPSMSVAVSTSRDTVVVPANFMQEPTKTKPIDKKFVSLALISAGSTFADSYTTLFARENWMAGKKGVCNVETQSAYLYGTHPTVGRAYAVASAKTVGSVLMAYYLRKHHSRFWSLPLLSNTAISLQGVSQNLAACN